MSKAPNKPPLTNIQRMRETCSFNTKCANKVTTKGVNMLMAVNSATGMRSKLKNAKALQSNNNMPRTICSL